MGIAAAHTSKSFQIDLDRHNHAIALAMGKAVSLGNLTGTKGAHGR